ncbi:MAG: branched-chain amino acid ABC transporter permease [Deltaproteobacteria bacterium]|nr:branched-chain amino acid ABC transporter permease [Deltaproteobacteria bacterium]
MLVQVLDILIAGLLLGGIYALISVGLSLQYGVARVLNVAHGEFMMLGALATWSLNTVFGLNPLVCMAVCGPVAFGLGYGLDRTVFKRLRTSSPSLAVFEGNSMLASFGLLFIIQNLAAIVWGTEIRAYTFLTYPVSVFGALFAANRLLTLAFAVVLGVVFYLFLARTRLGRAIRAAAQDPGAAALMGVNINRVLALCFGFGALMAGLAGLLVSMSYPVHTTMGLEYTIITIIVVVLGGLGSIPGSFIGGFTLGLIGSIVTKIEPGLSLASYYLLFMLLLWIKPTGLMGK